MLYMVPRAQDLAKGFRDALDQARTLAVEAGTREAAIAVHIRFGVRSTAISDVMGVKGTRELLAGKALVHGVAIYLVTARSAGRFTRGPLVAAYVSPAYLAKLMSDPRVTDLIFLPWNAKEESAFFVEHAPQLLSVPPGWTPVTGDSTQARSPVSESGAPAVSHAGKVLASNPGLHRPHVVLLGAGASLAACPKGDAVGKRLPLMNNFAQVLGLHDCAPESVGENFESFYSRVAADASQHGLAREIEERVYAYFASLRLPDTANIYDYLVLSLRKKDVIATFNWDPFLLQALRRNSGVLRASAPSVLFLHGNVLQGLCERDKILGVTGGRCPACGEKYTRTPLLYPISDKDYEATPYLTETWMALRSALKRAFMVTIFGYGAPKSDRSAVQLLKDAWGEDRSMEQFEIIDVRPETKLRESWREFVHTHHYETHRTFFKSSLAMHPRRTEEDYVERFLKANSTKPSWVPRNVALSTLQAWYKPLVDEETLAR